MEFKKREKKEGGENKVDSKVSAATVKKKKIAAAEKVKRDSKVVAVRNKEH